MGRGPTRIGRFPLASVTFDLKGAREIDAALATLQKKTALKILRQAIRKGGELIRREMIHLAPQDTGELSRNILKKSRLRKRKTKGVNVPTVVSQIGPSADVFWGTFLEVGTSQGHPARPFIRPALDNQVQPVLNLVLKTLRKGIDSAARKAKKAR